MPRCFVLNITCHTFTPNATTVISVIIYNTTANKITTHTFITTVSAVFYNKTAN